MYEAKINELEEFRRILADHGTANTDNDDGDDYDDEDDPQMDIREWSHLINEARQDKGILFVTYKQLKEESEFRLAKRINIEHESQEERSAQEMQYEEKINAEDEAEGKASKMKHVVADTMKRYDYSKSRGTQPSSQFTGQALETSRASH